LPEVLENSAIEYQCIEVSEQKLPVVGDMCVGDVYYAASVTWCAEMLPVLEVCETVVATAWTTSEVESLPRVQRKECQTIQLYRDLQTQSLPKLET